MNRWMVLFVATMLASFVAMGCSGGGGSPVTPNIGPGLTAETEDHGTQGTQVLWGYYDLYFDLENGTVEAVPNRNIVFTANVVDFVNASASNLQFLIHGTPVDPGGAWIDVDIDVSITHPFPGMHQYDGWDVRGLFIGDGSANMAYDPNLSYAVPGDQEMYDYDLGDDPDIGYPDPYDGLVGMPDGYSRWWNVAEFTDPGPLGYTEGVLASIGYESTATLNPYKYFCDGLGVEDDLWTWLNTPPNADDRGVFTAGATNTRNYYLRFAMPDPNVNYDYAITATWGEAPGEPPPAVIENAIEAVTCTISVTDDIYYVDDLDYGGNLIASIDTWGWPVLSVAGGDIWQPSTVIVESMVFAAPVPIPGPPVPGGVNYSTWTCDLPTDVITSAGMTDLWVIAEYSGKDYTCQYPAAAPAAALAAFFRFELFIADTPYCLGPADVTAISPPSAAYGGTVNATITGTFTDGPQIGAILRRAGESDIVGTSATWTSATTMTADFALADPTALGLWDVVCTHDDCPTQTTGTGLFEVLEPSPFGLVDSGPLPTPVPTSDQKDLSVIGNNVLGNAGVYYHYSSGAPQNYNIYKYPIDYSSAGTLHYNIQIPWISTNEDAWFSNGSTMAAIEMLVHGAFAFATNWQGSCPWYGRRGDALSWWGAGSSMSNGLIAFSKGDPSYIQCGRLSDNEDEWAISGAVWWIYGDPYGFELWSPADGDYNQVRTDAPCGGSDFNVGEWYLWDHTGNVDGVVAEDDCSRIALDSDPEGLDAAWDIIFYYLESAPSDNGIEVFQANRMIPSLTSNITTIDSALVGTAVDISCINAFGNIDGAAGNWVCVLEDNGDGTLQVAVFDQEGNLIVRSDPEDGDALSLDCDNENSEIHAWGDDAGTLTYYIWGWS